MMRIAFDDKAFDAYFDGVEKRSKDFMASPEVLGKLRRHYLTEFPLIWSRRLDTETGQPWQRPLYKTGRLFLSMRAGARSIMGFKSGNMAIFDPDNPPYGYDILFGLGGNKRAYNFLPNMGKVALVALEASVEYVFGERI